MWRWIQMPSRHFALRTMFRPTLYQILTASFCLIVIISNIISVQMVPLPYAGFSIPAGLFIYPLTFLLSDLVTERFGAKPAKQMVYLALAINVLSLGVIEALLLLLAKSEALHALLGLSGLRIFASLFAYFVSQIVDIQLYAWIKRWTNGRFLWLRNNGSTCTSQVVDTLLIDIIYLYWGLGMSMEQVMPIMLFSYAYKAFFSVATTPLFYLCVFSMRTARKY